MSVLILVFAATLNKTSVIVIFPQNSETEELNEDELDGVHFPAAHISIVKGARPDRPYLMRVNDITFSSHSRNKKCTLRHPSKL